MVAKLLAVAFSSLLALAAGASAQGGGTTRPAYREGRGFGGYGAFGMRPEARPKWEEVEKFFRENSPHRFDALDRVPEKDKPKFREFYTRLYMSVRGLERAGDMELATLKKKQIRIEDDIFAKRMTLRMSETLPPPDRTRLQEELRELVRQRVLTRLAERSARLERMRRLLDQEAKQLDGERARIDQSVESQYQSELKSMSDKPMPGREGPGRRFRRDDEKRPPREEKQ